MLGTDHKLVRVTGMLKVMDKASSDNSKHVMFFQIFTNVSSFKHIMEPLQRVQNMNLVMEGILFEIASGYLPYKCDQTLERYVTVIEQFMLLEDLISEVLQGVL